MVPITAQSSQAAIFPPTAAYNPAGGALFRLDDELIQQALSVDLYRNVGELMRDIDFTLPRECKAMEECKMTKGETVDSVPWRKTMSHIFGRNKNCTRSIPEHVWMWMCRKHYQRGRYRNQHEFNRALGKLVQMQILRLEAWSNRNQDWGMPQEGVIEGWSLVIRRREQIRLDNKKRKRKESVDEESPDGHSEPSSPTTPEFGIVPDWLLALLGPNKTTFEIQEIVMRISRELDSNMQTLFPDVEILPNITGERAKPKNNRAKTRKAAAKPVPRAVAAPATLPAPSRAAVSFHEAKRQQRAADQYSHGNLPYHPSPHSAMQPDRGDYSMAPTLPDPFTNRAGYPDPRVTYPDPRTAATASANSFMHGRSASLGSHPTAFSSYQDLTNPYASYHQSTGYPPYPQQPSYPRAGPTSGSDYPPLTTAPTPGTAAGNSSTTLRQIDTTSGGPAFAASQLGQNGFYDAAYYADRRGGGGTGTSSGRDHNQPVQQQGAFDYYRQHHHQSHSQQPQQHPSSMMSGVQTTAAGGANGANGARHARHLSMPHPQAGSFAQQRGYGQQQGYEHGAGGAGAGAGGAQQQGNSTTYPQSTAGGGAASRQGGGWWSTPSTQAGSSGAGGGAGRS